MCIEYFASRMERVACMYGRRLDMHTSNCFFGEHGAKWPSVQDSNPELLARRGFSARCENNLSLDHCALCIPRLLPQLRINTNNRKERHTMFSSPLTTARNTPTHTTTSPPTLSPGTPSRMASCGQNCGRLLGSSKLVYLAPVSRTRL